MAKENELINQIADSGAMLPMEGSPAQSPTAMRKLREKIKARYPDDDPRSEEDWMALEDRYAEDVEGTLGKYKDSEMTLQEVMTAYPELAMILNDIVNNKMPVRAAIAKHFSQEDLISQEGDDDYDAFTSAYNERVESAKKRSALDKEIDANQEESMATIDAYCAEKGHSEQQKEELLAFINDTFQDLLMKKVTKPILDAFNKAMTYDKDIETATKVGEVSGRNTAIEAKKAKEKVVDDGVPTLSKGGSIAEKEIGRNQRLFGDIGKRKGI